mgnify:CR=1 FL=1
MKKIKKNKEFIIDNFIKLNKLEKKNYIIFKSKKIKNIPKNIIKDLHQAYRYGADETSIVEGMAIISHETGIPSRSSTGRVLASLTAKPEALLLAGELLYIDGRYQESWEILEPLFANHMFSEEEDIDFFHKSILFIDSSPPYILGKYVSTHILNSHETP